MTNLIQSLESRLFLSATVVTAATLNADEAVVLADATTIKADVKGLFGEDTVQAKLVAAAFKTLPKVDQTFLKSLDLDETKGASFLTKDISALVTASSALVKKSTTAGTALFTKASPRTIAAAQKDITALGTITNVPLTNLQALFSSTKLEEEREAIVAAFPAETELVNAIIAEETNSTNGRTTILGEAVQYQTDIATLAADLTSVRAAYGTFPNLVGTFTGTATAKSGQTAPITLIFSTEDTSSGKVTGTVTDETTGGLDIIKGTVSLNGKLALVASGESRGTVSGQVAGESITGKFSIGKISGTFVASEAIT